MTDCINLRDEFGAKYFIEYDPAVAAMPGLRSDPWYQELPCKFGRISPQGGDQLRLDMKESATKKAKEVRRLLKGKLIQEIESDEGSTFILLLSDLPLIIDTIRPRKRPVLSEVERESRRNRILQRHPHSQSTQLA